MFSKKDDFQEIDLMTEMSRRKFKKVFTKTRNKKIQRLKPHFFTLVPGWQVILSVFLTIPCAMGVSYLLFYQLHRLRLEYILCALMLSLQAAELLFAILFVFTLCRPTRYD
uniref:(northern house mosquito) hypothetical protein n=1 Tax=Culex pipiens TaxID=7175 RepID=A0A8D8CU33_CULPI